MYDFVYDFENHPVRGGGGYQCNSCCIFHRVSYSEKMVVNAACTET